ncbi:MAG TPA: hypothetical protein VF326_13895, partial [Anaerolineaceae bacterium]
GYFLQLSEDTRMSKSGGGFLRVLSLIERGYDPLAYRLFCLSAHYRAKLNFSWDGIDASAKSLDRLRVAAYAWGQPGTADGDYLARFSEPINEDLNMPRAMAVTWDLVKSALPAPVKKATLLEFDKVLGLGLAGWAPAEEKIPDKILDLVEKRLLARREKRWKDADALRDQIGAAGYTLEDTPQGPRVKATKIIS